MKPIIIATHSQHIDNGGVSFSIIDKGVEAGIVLEIETQYFGYPAIKSTMQIDQHLGADWLEKIGLMFIGAAKEVSKIDWRQRYEGKGTIQ